MLPLRIVADPHTIEQLIGFFSPPVGVDVSGFAESTKQAASAVGSAATHEVRAAMAKAKGLYLTVDASAPVLILPKSLDASAQEPTLCVSLGRVRLQARPLSEAEKQRRLSAAAAITGGGSDGSSAAPLHATAANEPGSPDHDPVAEEALYYYPHKASFSKFYLELTTLEWAMRRPQRGFLVVPEVSIAVDVLQRIDDHHTAREAMVLRLRVPSLRVACSVHQIYLITTMVDAWFSRLKPPATVSGCRGLPEGRTGRDVPGGTGGVSPPRLGVEELRCGAAEVSSAGADMHREGQDGTGARGRGPPTPGNVSSGPVSRASSPPFPKTEVLRTRPNQSSTESVSPKGSSDLPLMRLELLVEGLGLDVHDDNSDTLTVVPLPAFQVECASAELIVAVRSRHKKMLLWLKRPHIVAARDTEFPIFSGGGVRVDVLLSEGDAPVALAVGFHSSLKVCIGTPCVELLETVMDMVNLALSAMDTRASSAGCDTNRRTATAVEASVADRSESGGLGHFLPPTMAASAVVDDGASTNGNPALSCSKSTASRMSDLEYQIDLVRQQCSMPSRHVADVFVRIPGSITVTLLNRAPGESKDVPFASASMRAIKLRLSKYTVKMDLSGHVGEVSASVLASLGLSKANRTLLAYRPPSGDGEPGCGTARLSGSSSSSSSSSSSAASHSLDENAHIIFSFRKSLPVMPLFTQVNGKRSLVNAQELRYSSAVELQVGASTITLDLHTVMIFKTYFTAGLFSRISRVAERPLYNGRTLPPTREGPRLLMSMRVAIRDTLVVLPVDPRAAAADSNHRFCASLGKLILQNSLRAREGHETMGMSLSEVDMWREELHASALPPPHSRESSKAQDAPLLVHQRSSLLTTQMCLEMAVRTPIDLQSEDPPCIDIRSEDASLQLQETDLVQLVTLLRQNLTRTDPVDIAAYTLETSEVRQRVLSKDGQCIEAPLQHPTSAVLGDNTSFSRGGVSFKGTRVGAVAGATRSNEALYVTMRMGRISMLLSDTHGEEASNPLAAGSSRFQLHSAGVSMSMSLPSNRLGVQWRSLELDDVRDNTTSVLVYCEAGSLHLADSLTTHKSLMLDFGLRRTAMYTTDTEEEGKMDTGVWCDTKASSRLGDSRANASPNLSVGSSACAPSTRRISESSNTEGHLLTDTQPFTLSVLSADFTLRRFAVSDQWLALSDLVCNEAVMSAWSAAQTGTTSIIHASPPTNVVGGESGDGGAAPHDRTTLSSSRSGMRVVITTPNVVIPFLNSRRETLIEASIIALLADVVQLPTTKQVAVKVCELSVLDVPSGEKILFKRCADRETSSTVEAAGDTFAPAPATQNDREGVLGTPFSPLIGGGGGAAADNASRAPAPSAAHGASILATTAEPNQSEVLHFRFKSDPEANINNIQLEIGELDALVSMPIVQGLVDYFTSPAEPVAKIASLGVMREQRARMAAAAQQMANSTLLVLHVLWRQPRIILAGDAMQLQRRSGNLEMRLGVMQTAVRMNSSAAELSVLVNVQEYSIPSLLKRSALRFAYEARSGVETIGLHMERTTALFHPADVERLVRLAQLNVLVPRDVNYYGPYEKAVPQPNRGSVAPDTARMAASVERQFHTPPALTPQADGEPPAMVAPPPPPPPSRTVQVHINGLSVAVYDTVGVNTHTLTLAALDTVVLTDGRVALWVPSLCMVDQLTGRCMLQSETVSSSGRSQSGTPAARATAAAMAPMGSGSDGNFIAAAVGTSGNFAAAATTDAALRVTFNPTERTSEVQIGAVVVTVIPRSLGTLLNTLLSVHIPSRDEPNTLETSSPPTPSAGQPVFANTTASTSVRRSAGSTDRMAAAAAAVTTTTAAAAVAHDTSAMLFTFTATLGECRVRFCQGDREVAVLRLASIACSSNSYPDGASELVVTLDNLSMIDSATVNTNYRTFIYSYEDAEAGDAPSADKNLTGNTRSVMRTPVVPLDPLVTYEVRTDAAPKTDFAQKSDITDTAVSTAPVYRRHMKCRFGSLCFVVVPDVVRTVVSILREAQAHISDCNRDKAYTYVSDRAAESMRRRNETEQLMEFDVLVHRPQVLLVDKPTSTSGVQLSPGSLIVNSRLVLPSDITLRQKSGVTATTYPSSKSPELTESEAKMAAMAREVFTLHVRKMGMLLQDESCFQKECTIHVQFERALPTSLDASTRTVVTAAMGTDHTEEKAAVTDVEDGAVHHMQSMLKVDIPVLSMALTHRQTDFAMDVLGALVNGTETNHAVAKTGPTQDGGRAIVGSTVATTSPADNTGGQSRPCSAVHSSRAPLQSSSSRCTTGTGADFPMTAPSETGAGWQKDGTAARATLPAVASTSPFLREQSVPHPYMHTKGGPSTSFTLIAHIGFMQADVGDVFRLQLEEAQVLSTDVSTTGKTTDVHVGSLRAQHVGVEVVAPPSSDASASRPLSVSKDARTGPRNTSCIQELVDLLTVTELHILYVQPQPDIDVDAGSSVVENSVSISAGVFSVSLSPTILFDTREMLYLPFYSKVLRVPIDPIPVLSLMDETTTLQEDVVLDYKHVLWTANRTRCCYVLDLNGHKLVLTDVPSSQIVLYEGCELTITNGTVHIPGMYTIGSYVSFAPSTALFTTDSVRFEKEFLNLPNKAFCRPSLPPPTEPSSDGVARGGRLEGPQSPRGAHFSISETSTRAFLMDDRGSSAVAVPHMPHITTTELRDRTVRLLASFSCDAMEVRMLSEEVVDLSIALRMRGRVKFLQENENEKPMRRSVSLQLLGVRSGESEEHVLLPTDIVMNVSGVESVSVSLVLDSIEFCTRATLLRSLVEIWKDFSAAIIEETTISRVKSCIEYETQSLDPLLPVLTAGECEHCGQSDAYLAPAANRPGILCYKCCTGHDHVPAIDFRVEVPLIDVIMIGSKSDMAHIFMRNVLLSINPSMDLDLVMRMSICGFSNAAAVWEPLIEQFDATISGSVKSHDYKVHTDRFDYVVSPHSLRLVSGMAADYGDAAALQKKLRKRFSRQKQLRMQLAAPIQGSRMYADAVALDEDVWLRQQEEEALSLNDADATGFNPFRSIGDADNSSTAVSGTAASLVKKSMLDTLSEANEQLMGSGVGALKGTTPLDSDAPALPPKRGYAHVYVTSHCDVELSISSHHIAPHGGTLRFVARESCVTISRRVKPDEPQPEGCATNIANPPLYLQTEDMLVETRVVLGQEEGGCHLRRTVTIIIYPLHISRTIICLENRLCCALASTPNNPPVQPSGRLYMAPKADLNTAIFVKPVGALDRVEYEAGKPIADALSGSSSCVPAKMPTLQEVLCGASLVVSCKAKTATAKSMAVVVYVRQEEMRGGVPTFVIVIASRFRLRNRLPYRLIVNVVPDADGSLAKRKVLLRPVQPLASTVLGARQSENLGLNEYSLNQVAFMLEVRQPAPRTAAVSTAASAASASSSLKGQPAKEEEEEEIFTTLIPTAVSRDKPFIILRSRQQRQLVIRATYVTNSSTVTFSTPYVLLNHSPIPLTVRECTRSGENRMYEAEPNFSVLDANMNASIAACPMNIRKSEEFFVNLYHKGYRGTCVPLHAQERGVVIMESGSARADRKKGSSSTDRSSGGDKKKGTVSTASTPAPTVIHLAYSSQVDPNGSVLVIITPRWVLVNRSSLPLYAAPSTYGGITAEAAAAAATTAVVAAQQQKSTEGGCSGELPPKASLTLRQTEVDAMKHVLQDMAAADSILFLSDPPTQVVALPPQSATPLLETPFCGPDVGYHLHILQSPFAPLYGTPVGIENIHSELIIVYEPLSDTSDCAAGEKACWARSKDHSRDRFLEVMLTVKDSYTYIVLEPQAYAPYLLLNRTAYAIDVRDTAAKSKGRLMARVAPGCGTELLLDSTVTTLIQLELFSSDGGRRLHEVSFDVGRPMTRREVNDASVSATGVLYTLSFGGHGQQIIEITSAKAALPIAYTSIATPPIPINVLLNVAVVTLSVVMPNKDVLFCAITDVRFSWDRQNDREMTKFSIENFQVDNQTEVSPRYDSCVLSLRTSKSVAAASGYLERILVPSKSLICLEEVRLDVLPLAVRVSDTLLVALASFVQAVRTGEDARQLKQANQSLLGGSTSTFGAQEAAAAATAAHERNPSPTDLYQRAPVQIDIWASRLTLERLIINPIVVRVWLTRDVDEHDFFRENINVKDAALLSMMVSSCEDVVVAAPGIVTAKQSSRLGIFVQWVLKTYTDGLLSRLKGILLQYASSLPMIGAPLKLATGFGSGAVRLFREPIEGLSTSASAFAIGLARGSAGFAQEFAGGGLGALSNITDSWSRLLSMGGGVSERDRRKQNIFTGIARGIKGVIQRPIEGAAESGATGLLKGTAQGLVGVLANPMSGLLSDMSRATGTLAKIVTDTYVPKTRRLRPIRDFYANGGVAPWRSVVSVYQYQRIQASTRTWSGDHLISSVDGPAWYPSKRENLTFGKSRTPIPQDRWILDRFHTNFMGWTYSTKYYGIYSDRLTDNVRVRRMRWTALIRPLPYSRVACYLNVCPGLETQQRRTASLASTVTTAAPLESTIVFAQPGALHATTVEHTKARNRRLFGLRPFGQSRSSSVTGSGDRSSKRSSSKSRGANANNLLAEEEEEGGESTNLTERINERLRSWTAAGRNVGVRGTILRSHSGMLDDNEELPDATEPPLLGDLARAQSSRVLVPGGGSTIMVRAPSAPRDRQRRTRSSHSRSNSDLDAILSPGMSGYGDSYTEHRDNRRSRRQNSHDGEQARTATASEFAPETVGSRVPAPARYSRSASGRMLPVNVDGSVAPVPGASPIPAPRTASNANAPPASTIVEVYEYEKKVPMLGWGKRFLPSECPAWQDVHGHEVPSRREIHAPAGWIWVTDWTIIGGAEDGWTILGTEERNVRRRMWQRRLVKQVVPPSPNK
ncbi:hypothetical protein JKF63_05286 [Porcisia hertigi]|uniref:Uncharacterized protein n=1 Tax=Porcisia hertigi TaxID=2761500 RepID=A0A836IMB8_9TRYP|nr:hypothetical protein JKF63_05286 [Porcisia hertigi]